MDFFRRKRGQNENSASDDIQGEVLGDTLGAKAGLRNQTLLTALWAVNASHAPAAVRPDPDLLARRMLRQFRTEGTTLARTIGAVENYRSLLGGAPQDFLTFPADGYDATSVLANMKVAEQLCSSLVAPSSWQHPGWNTILPYALSSKRENLTWMLQRMTGVSSTKFTTATIDSLVTILDKNNGDADLGSEDYVAPCMAVMIDAQSLFL